MNKFTIAGVNYENRDGTPRRDIIAKLSPGAEVVFKRDRGNIYDSNAILVLTKEGHDIGFVPKEIARDLAPVIDSGVEFSAHLQGYDVVFEESVPTIESNTWFKMVSSILKTNQVFDQTMKKCNEKTIRFYMDLELFLSENRVIVFVLDEKDNLRTCTITLAKDKEVLLGMGDFTKTYWKIPRQTFDTQISSVLGGMRDFHLSNKEFPFGKKLTDPQFFEMRSDANRDSELFREYMLYVYNVQKADFNFVVNPPKPREHDVMGRPAGLYSDMSWMVQPANQVEMFFHQFLMEDRFVLGYETTPAEKLAASLMSVTLLYEAMKGNFQIDPSILREFIRDYTEICELPNLHLENFPKQRMSPEIISVLAWDFLNMIPDVTMNDLKGISQVQADYCSRVFPTIYPKVYATIWPFQRKAAA